MTIGTDAAPLRDNAGRSRYELEIDGETVYADYRRQPGLLVISSVYAPPALRGTGAAGRLLEQIAARVRQENLRIVARCGYAFAWLRRHPVHRDLLG